MDRVSYPVVKINEGAAIKFVYTQYFTKPRRDNENSRANLVKGTPSGELSAKNSKRIKELIVNLHTAINARNGQETIRERLKAKPLSFITLTLSSKQVHDDKYIKRHMLGRFLVTLNQNNYAKNFIWKAERQKNGNIHFHIITDSYIPRVWLREQWNKIQYDHGYTTNDTTAPNSLKAPSTEIKACKSVNQTAGYAAKYISKQDSEQKIEGRVWGCSDRVKNLKSDFYLCEDSYTEALEEGVKKGLLKKKPFEYGDLYTGKIRQYLAEHCPQLLEQYLVTILESWEGLQGIKKEAEPIPEPADNRSIPKPLLIQMNLF